MDYVRGQYTAYKFLKPHFPTANNKQNDFYPSEKRNKQKTKSIHIMRYNQMHAN